MESPSTQKALRAGSHCGGKVDVAEATRRRRRILQAGFFFTPPHSFFLADKRQKNRPRACPQNHFRNLHAPLCGIFHPNSVVVARYDALIRAKSPTNCDAHLAESIWGACSSILPDKIKEREENYYEKKNDRNRSSNNGNYDDDNTCTCRGL